MKTLLLILLLVPMMSFGQNNHSMNFDGDNDYVNCGTNIDLANTSFTLTAWVKKNGADFTGGSIVMSTGNGTLNNGLYFGFNYQNGDDYLFFNFYTQGGICYSTNPVNIEADGLWHHVAATYNYISNERIIYLDGQVIGSDISSSPFLSSNTEFSIGITSWNLVDDFEGEIDDVCVWDIVLDSNQIQGYMNCPPTGTEIGLVGYWDFEEGSGMTAYDLTSNGNDGTINGATYSTDVPVQSCCTTDTSYTDVTVCDTTYFWNDSTYSQSGIYSYAEIPTNNNYSIDFDGNGNYIDVPHSNSLNFNTDISFSCWVNVKPTMTNTQFVGKGNDKFLYWDDNFENDYNPSNGFKGFQIELDNTPESVELFDMNYNSWYYLSWTFSTLDNTFKVYKNGTFIREEVDPNILTACVNTADLYISGGDIVNPSWDWSNAVISELELWSIRLSQDEIQNYMNCPPVGTETGLVGYWNFEEGSGSTAYDLTSNGNNGTINGATYSTDVPVQSCTLTNAAGCDSVAVLNLTIESPTSSTIVIDGLDSYTAPSGTVYTTGGVYTDTIQNAAGCDSIITIDLSLNYTGIGELNNTTKQLIKIVDVLGRETPFKPNTPLLYIYNDGTVERKMIIKE